MLIAVPGRSMTQIPPRAGPAGKRGWHDVVYRALDVALGRRNPRARASLSWRLDPKIYRVVRDILGLVVRPGDTVLDIGASWGLFTFRLSDLVGPKGRVIAFEPNPLVLPSLEAIAAHGANVDIHALALSDEPGSAELHVPTLNRTLAPPRAVHPMASLERPDNRTEASHETVAVEVRRLDDVVEPPARESISFLKIDVEGHELAVLRGGEETLAGCPAIWVEIEQRHQDAPIQDFFDHLAARGYDGHILHGTRLRPISAFDVERDQLAYLRPDSLFSAAPAGYLHNFLFVANGTDVSSLST
jgi:FkbM family methyltransferase